MKGLIVRIEIRIWALFEVVVSLSAGMDLAKFA
jgi:hypothetical protein